ncbi:hypothetical protein CN173_19790 [Sinorhizobium meliloti]|nr:hypothetical protein [Sinorhizobium meliloti]RVJ92381.1 hypothetical protein CN173_19790 [Sinorhizobium meliloti]
MELGRLKEALATIDSQVKEGKEELRATCKRLASISMPLFRTGSTHSRLRTISLLKADVKALELASGKRVADDTDLSALSSVPDLRAAYQFLAEKLKGLQETLSAPQRRYQRYVQALSDVQSKMTAVMGEQESPKPGTIKDLEQHIRYIEEGLRAKLDERYEDRDRISRSIFEAKTKVRTFYEALKTNVEDRLTTINSDAFMVTLDASFVPSHGFAEDFFDHPVGERPIPWHCAGSS